MQTSETIHPDKTKIEEVTSYRNIGNVLDFNRDHQQFVFFCEQANILLKFIQPDVLRVKLFWGEKVDTHTTAAIVGTVTNNLEINVEVEEDRIKLSSPTIQAVITKHPFSLRVFDQKGNLFFEEQTITWDQRGSISCSIQKETESHFYGFGEKTSFLDKRGEKYTMWNSDVYDPHVPEIEALYQSIPFFIHFSYQKEPFGLFLDNPGKTIFDMRSENDSFSIQTITGDLDFYLIHGATMKDIIFQYTELTGRTPLPPKWACGYHQSRYSYMNQEEVLELARTFRAKKIPCDVIHLDIHYMDEYRVFTWDGTRFPNPKKMLKELKEMGFRIVPIVDPGVKKDPKYPIYREGIENDYFCKYLEGKVFTGDVWPGESAFPDFTDDKAANWWGENHKFYVDQGIHGIWNDMNEPAVFNESKTMDLDVMHKNNGDKKMHEELHNLYGMLMSKATFEGLEKQLNGERPFVLTRAGYADIQRYAAVWTGDNRSFWEHMAMAIPMVLNLGLSGIPFAGPDIGGFAHHASGELLARWMQMGAFFPFCRNHSAIDTVRQEPWAFGEEIESISRQYIEMRYKWMPYFYSLFYSASQTGLPIVRPLLLEYPEDRNVYNLCDQFLLGDQVIVAPIYRPDTQVRSVYLPEGGWVDFWTGEFYKGGEHILKHAPLDILPLFIKAGAILPESSVRQHAGESEPLTMNVYIKNQSAQSSFQLYEDDGQTYKYENGEYNLIQFNLQEERDELRFSCTYQHNGYKVNREFINVIFKNIKQAPKTITDSISWVYDGNHNELNVRLLSEPLSQTFQVQF
ncbi:MAG: glycoside hydrolase family 31 protein [Bacillota bacterium]|nr:glycoside hydrolase family 31 protein [Bacillota bacterium]